MSEQRTQDARTHDLRSSNLFDRYGTRSGQRREDDVAAFITSSSTTVLRNHVGRMENTALLPAAWEALRDALDRCSVLWKLLALYSSSSSSSSSSSVAINLSDGDS